MKEIQPQNLLEQLQCSNLPVVIDVRTGFEFRNGHIPGAVHAPTWKIALCLAGLPRDKETALVVTCEHGPRAVIAKALLEFMGYRNAVLLAGHMASWRQKRFPQAK